jgi:hypothetical protein
MILKLDWNSNARKRGREKDGEEPQNQTDP